MNLLIDGEGRDMEVTSVADWEGRREGVLVAMQEVMGILPGEEKRCALEVEVGEEVDCGGYVRQLVSYAAEPGGRVPAYLLVPKGEGPFPGVLCPHPTDNVAGHKVVVGLSEKSHRSYASELAERGFVALAPAYPLLADYQPDWGALGYQSATMKAIWDNARGLDLLDGMDCVAGVGYGAIGHSLGGHNSIYTAVFDARIQVVVSCCGFDSYRDYMDGDISGWASQRYMPRLLDYALEEIPFDFHDMIAALAPRPFLAVAPLGDANFKWESVDRIAVAARRVYAAYGAAEELMVEHPDCGHDFPDALRERAYRLLERYLKAG
ncbi:MAG: alpha/beta hydrolase [Candidatus Latescibacterota bacterium]|nr:alpha/beta hydrolase [Candidatus Latescibacterota bacterium]